MNEYLSFRKMITPMFIHVLFWFFSAVCIIIGLTSIIAGLTAKTGGGGTLVLAGLGQIIVGPIFVRIWCEVLMIFFKMHDELKSISAKIAPDAEPQKAEAGEKPQE